MATKLSLIALNTVFELRVAGSAPASYVAAVTRAWSRCLATGSAAPAACSAKETGPLEAPVPADDSPDAMRAALQRLSQAVTRHLIEAQTGHLLMLHAGAVSDPVTGGGLVFVAPSGTGKTTLAGLLGQAHGYLTDETAGIDPATGQIHPYPKPLSVPLREEARRKTETSPDDLGLVPTPEYATASRIMLLTRDPDHVGEPRIEQLGTLDAIMALLPETSALACLPRPLHLLAGLLEATGHLRHLTYREATDLVDVIPAMGREVA